MFLEEKLNKDDSRVISFVKEMSELLDSHEISTNIGSEDNYSQYFSGGAHLGSFDSGNIDEESDNIYRKLRGSTQEHPREKISSNLQKKIVGYQK